MYDNYDCSDQSHLQGLASPIDNVCVFPSFSSFVATVELPGGDNENTESVGLGQELDPLGERILEAARGLLAQTAHITIKDLMEVTGLGDAVLRRRLSHIVDLRRLGCIPGSGRAPSQYYLLAENNSSEANSPLDGNLSDEQILEKIKQKEVRLLEELDSLKQDRAALERAISVRRKYLGK